MKALVKDGPNAWDALKNGEGVRTAYEAMFFPKTYAEGKLNDAEQNLVNADRKLQDELNPGGN